MTDLCDPSRANVFVVGHNQARAYPVEAVGDHERFLDAHFNRHGCSCRGLYDEITNGESSATRDILDGFTALLTRAGVIGIVETNAVCYSTQMSAELSHEGHRAGRERGRQLFRHILEQIRPSVIIAHDQGTITELERVFGLAIPRSQVPPNEPVPMQTPFGLLYATPSLAQPGFNRWKRWSTEYLERVATAVASQLSFPSSTTRR
jgi:hypothetical protein